MKRPEIGKLNRRVTIRVVSHVPDQQSGFALSVDRSVTVWGSLEVVGAGIYFGTKQVESTVTHRVTVRRIKGKTQPQDLTTASTLTIDGIEYLIRRVADLGGAERFTVIDCEEKGVGNARQRIGGRWL